MTRQPQQSQLVRIRRDLIDTREECARNGFAFSFPVEDRIDIIKIGFPSETFVSQAPALADDLMRFS